MSRRGFVDELARFEPDDNCGVRLFDKDFLGEGLVHRLYRLGDRVYKTPKEGFPELECGIGLKIEELTSHLLQHRGLPAPETFGLRRCMELRGCQLALCRAFVVGRTYDWPRLASHGETIRLLFDRVHDIALPGFGDFTLEVRGNHSSWRAYLRDNHLQLCDWNSLLTDATRIAVTALLEILNKLITFIDYDGDGKLLLIDANPGNVLWRNDGQLAGVIDIDHPAIGDPLYDFGCLLQQHEATFRAVTACNQFSAGDHQKIAAYAVLAGLRQTYWLWQHKLPYANTLSQTQRVATLLTAITNRR
jgi:hypothetical protein